MEDGILGRSKAQRRVSGLVCLRRTYTGSTADHASNNICMEEPCTTRLGAATQVFQMSIGRKEHTEMMSRPQIDGREGIQRYGRSIPLIGGREDSRASIIVLD
jgi:hypothetical protein